MPMSSARALVHVRTWAASRAARELHVGYTGRLHPIADGHHGHRKWL